MKITKKDLIGAIENFPIEVVEKMIERQVEAGNAPNVKVFQNWIRGGKVNGGFDWKNTREGHDFWDDVIIGEKFEIFFKKYPKDSGMRVYVHQDGTIPGDRILAPLMLRGGINDHGCHGDCVRDSIYFIDPETNIIEYADVDTPLGRIVMENYTEIETSLPKVKFSMEKVLECLSWLSGVSPDRIEIVND